MVAPGEKKYCQKARRTVREPRNTSLVLNRCDGSYETTLLSPGSHAFRCCKQGPYKQNISRNVHTLLVVMKIKVQPIFELVSPNDSIQLIPEQHHGSFVVYGAKIKCDSLTSHFSLVACCLLCTIQINATCTGTVHVQKDKCRYT